MIALALLAAACSNDSPKTAAPTTTSSTSTTVATPTTNDHNPRGQVPPPPCGHFERASPDPNRTRYEINASLDLTTNQVVGTMRAVFTPDVDTDRIVMRLWPNGPTPVGHGGHVDLADVTVAGESTPVVLTNPTTAVAMHNLSAQEPVVVTAAFTIALPRNLDDRLSWAGNVVRLGSWLPLLPWEPGVGWALDPPTTSNAEASLSVHADFDVHLATPPGLAVLASGEDLGGGHWVANAAPDWAASVGQFTVARSTTADGVPVVVGVDAAVHESPTTYLNRVVPALNDLARRYGDYPWPAYTLAITPSLKGGIEYPGHVMQGPNTNTRTTPHEAAHQWFYGLVGNDQGRDPWLDEGLASWAEAQVNHTYASFRTKPIPSNAVNQIGQPMTFWDGRHGSYYRGVYVQTVQALAALNATAAQVDCALAEYVGLNAFRVATPDRLVQMLNKDPTWNAVAVLTRYGAKP